MAQGYILALDQGTTGSTAILFDTNGQVCSQSYREIPQYFPQPGWVEQDPDDYIQSCLDTAEEAIQNARISPSMIKGIGITNQRETTIVWERESGKPVYNAIVWQCRRTASLCEDLKKRGLEETARRKTGLPIDAYFSATKLRWLLDHIPEGQRRAEAGELLFGTVDSWLLWNFTKEKAHLTDFSNASRTMLYNIHKLEWDRELLTIFNIPEVMLPKVVPSSMIYGETKDGILANLHLPIASIAGDQQAALFGQACYEVGMAKNTYGTGSFVLVNIGEKPVLSEKGLITTLAWGNNDTVSYALEGSIFVTGAAIQWLRDGLGFIATAAESESLAESVPDNGDVYFVPAFVGLGAPYWDMYARGTIIGLTRGTKRGHITRAALEAIAYQTRDIIESINVDIGIKIPLLRVDGGASVNRFLMQFQADILGMPIQVAHIAETTALGAAYLAGLAIGLWHSTEEIGRKWQASATFEPRMPIEQRDMLYTRWQAAVERARGWENTA